MDEKLNSLRNEPPLNRIPQKSPDEIRYLSFNVNSIKTLFNYHPWNQLSKSLDSFLSCMDGDVVSLQELKIPPSGLNQVCLLNRYRAFVLIPKTKRGYSGVGLYIRIPKNTESTHVKQNLAVLKAEEGITGLLIDPSSKKAYFNTPGSIGGYLNDEELASINIKPLDLIDLDSEGRCVVVELGNGTVVFSLYCPANSTQTADGEIFRLKFLQLLLHRCINLKNSGRNVVIMGDINVSPDLIDSAEAITLLTRTKQIINNMHEGGPAFEKTNLKICMDYRIDGSHRRILTLYLKPTIEGVSATAQQFLHDTTRHHKKRQTELYTVWNTQTNSRQANYGSRIDLILVSSMEQLLKVTRADILPYLQGSDHCPIFTDFDVSKEQFFIFEKPEKLFFEAKNFYKLVEHRDISSMFSAQTKRSSDDLETKKCISDTTKKKQKLPLLPQRKLTYTSRKTPSVSQQPINLFFAGTEKKKTNFAEKLDTAKEETLFLLNSDDDIIMLSEEKANSPGLRVTSIKDMASIYNDPPLCLHKEPTILKTSWTAATKGKKFWCCRRDAKGKSTELGEHRCNFFSWATKKGQIQKRGH